MPARLEAGLVLKRREFHITSAETDFVHDGVGAVVVWVRLWMNVGCCEDCRHCGRI